MVYNLYGLTPSEIAIIENKKQSQTKPISKGIRGMANTLQFRGLAL